MSPHPGETPGISLPPPVAEQLAGQSGPGGSAEQGPALPEAAPQTAAGQPLAGPPANQNQPQAAQLAGGLLPQPPQTDDSSTTNPAAVQMADDTDLIEKEWVSRAKQVVERTSDDPYKQSQELTRVKADYMKQRYNKVIKISE